MDIDDIISCTAIISSYDALLQLHGPEIYLRELGPLPPTDHSFYRGSMHLSFAVAGISRGKNANQQCVIYDPALTLN